jgi:hypothetical protein
MTITKMLELVIIAATAEWGMNGGAFMAITN